MNTKFATIALIGKPNVGKSSLLNYLVGQKVSIVTHKPQTTRTTITGVVTKDNTQFLFLDTPGIFATQNNLDKNMVRCAWSSIASADYILLLIDATKSYEPDNITKGILKKIEKHEQNNIAIVFNKVDKVDFVALQKLQQQMKSLLPNAMHFATSAISGKGVGDLIRFLKSIAPISDLQYDRLSYTTLSMRFIASEITREQLFLQLGHELPYKVKVDTESWEDLEGNRVVIKQVITTEEKNHKYMILGNKGQKIKSIGQKSRQEINKVLDVRAHLDLFVNVKKDWIENIEKQTGPI
jgi:GTP-binding protein Era